MGISDSLEYLGLLSSVHKYVQSEYFFFCFKEMNLKKQWYFVILLSQNIHEVVAVHST